MVINGFGKKYNSGKLVYELNNKKDGLNNKEYDVVNYKLIFEGGYLNGKRNGKEKEYYYNGKIIFEGEYLNGKRWNGKRRIYIGDKLVFEGEYLKGKKWNGKYYDKYNGKVTHELVNGKGKIIKYNNKGQVIFEGEYLNGQRNGTGIEYYDDKIRFFGG